MTWRIFFDWLFVTSLFSLIGFGLWWFVGGPPVYYKLAVLGLTGGYLGGYTQGRKVGQSEVWDRHGPRMTAYDGETYE